MGFKIEKRKLRGHASNGMICSKEELGLEEKSEGIWLFDASLALNVGDDIAALLEHDECIQLWRFHHVRMVERMVGHKIGTGGSEGVGYLRTTLDKKFFPDLWGARTLLRPPAERRRSRG